MSKEDAIEVMAVVIEPLPNAMFKVELENKHQVLAHVSGKMRKNFIKILPGGRGAFALRPEPGTDRLSLQVAARVGRLDLAPQSRAQRGISPRTRSFGRREHRHHEGTGISQEDLRQVQGDPPSRRSARDLRELQAQAAAGLKQQLAISN